MKKALAYIRLAAYAVLLLYIFVLADMDTGGGVCLIRRIFGLLCPSCGATRACISFMHLDLDAAMTYHPLFTLSVFPVSVILALQDTFVIIRRELFGKDENSLIERVFI